MAERHNVEPSGERTGASDVPAHRSPPNGTCWGRPARLLRPRHLAHTARHLPPATAIDFPPDTLAYVTADLCAGGGWGTQLEPVGVHQRPRSAPRVDRRFTRHLRRCRTVFFL